ncbi:hypothetical protein NQ318_011619 [Aromia moschata]|uniref:Uncharacterized protein n=1 Tax=Aromia moschata TaxID=1265417 RepID=A0AAV8Z7X5_9CUCU|nr:hypothetical protein NQ318_011619 [Aromia moschata]
MLLPARCERVATSMNRIVSGDTFPTLSSLDKPVGRSTEGLAEITGIDKECVHQLNRSKCVKFAQKWCQNSSLLTPEQKESRMNICADILNNIDTDPGLLDTVTPKGTRFESVEAVKVKATEVLNQLTEADF